MKSTFLTLAVAACTLLAYSASAQQAPSATQTTALGGHHVGITAGLHMGNHATWGLGDSKEGSGNQKPDGSYSYRAPYMSEIGGYSVGAFWGYATSHPKTVNYGVNVKLLFGSSYCAGDYITYGEVDVNPYLLFGLTPDLSLTAGLGRVFSLPTFKRIGQADEDLQRTYGDIEYGLVEKIDYVRYYSSYSYYLSLGARYSVSSRMYIGGQLQYMFLSLPVGWGHTRHSAELSLSVGYSL